MPDRQGSSFFFGAAAGVLLWWFLQGRRTARRRLPKEDATPPFSVYERDVARGYYDPRVLPVVADLIDAGAPASQVEAAALPYIRAAYQGRGMFAPPPPEPTPVTVTVPDYNTGSAPARSWIPECYSNADCEAIHGPGWTCVGGRCEAPLPVPPPGNGEDDLFTGMAGLFGGGCC